MGRSFASSEKRLQLMIWGGVGLALVAILVLYIARETNLVSGFIGLLRRYAGAVLIVLAPVVLEVLTTLAVKRVKLGLDRRHPDDLSMHAGAWTRAQAKALGLDGVRVIVAPDNTAISNAYVPSGKLICLGLATFFKRDPSHWATGAHELAHAVTFEKAWLWGWLSLQCRRVRRIVLLLAVHLLIANCFYHLPLISDVALALIWASLGVWAVVIMDEMITSIIGLRLMFRTPELRASHRRAAVLSLSSAWVSYVAGLAGGIFLLTQFGYVAGQIEAGGPFEPAEMPSGLWFVSALVFSVPLVIWALWGLGALTRGQTPGLRLDSGATLAALPLGCLILVVWNLPLGSTYVAAVLLASLSARDFWKLLASPVSLAVAVLGLGLAWLVINLTGLVRKSDGREDAPDISSIRHELDAGAEIAEDSVGLISSTVWGTVVWYGRRFAVVPLLFMLWTNWW